MPLGCILISCTSDSTLKYHFHSHCQSLYPAVDLKDVDKAFWHGLELTKVTILRLNIPGVDLNDWLLPTPIIEPEDYLGALVDGAWETAYH